MTEEEQRQQAAQEAMRSILQRQQEAETSRSAGTPESNAAIASIIGRMPEDQRPKTWGETGWDAAKSFGSGIARGVTSIADTPDLLGRTIASGVNEASKSLFGTEVSPTVTRALRSMPIPGMVPNATYIATGKGPQELAEEYAPEVMNYKPTTTTGKYSQTVGEFLPGAVIGPGGVARNVVVQGVIPALASEAAGQATEGTWAEPYARAAGAVVGGIGGNMAENGLRRVISPGGGAAAEDLAHAARLREAGIPVSAGQATKSPTVLGIEANNPKMQSAFNVADDSPQLKALTTAALKEAGLTDNIAARAAARPDLIGSPYLAQPQVMDELRIANGALFDQALQGVDVIPLRRLTEPLYRAATITNAPYEIQEAVDLIGRAARTGTNIPATELNRIRSELGKNLSSTDGNTAKAAAMARDAIDDLIENAAAVMGDPARMELLHEARRRHQALLVLDHAVKTATARGANGVVRPQDLSAALTAVYGRKNVVTGNVNRMGEMAQSGLNTIRGLGQSTAAGWKSAIPFGELLAGGGGGFGLLQLGAMMGAPLKLAAIPAAGAVGVAAIDAARRTARQALERGAHLPAVQKYLENQLVAPSSGWGWRAAGLRGAASGIPSYMADTAGPQAYGGRVERKAGGRVGIDHEKLADQLVGAAERAKKGISRGTEQLLDLPDDHVAHALEVANRSI